MQNISNFNVIKENLLLFLSLLILMLFHVNICLPIAFCMLFLSVIYGRNVIGSVLLFSLLLDVYVGNILGVTGAMFLSLFLLTRYYAYSLKNNRLIQIILYFFAIMCLSEFIGAVVSFCFHKNINIYVHFQSVIQTLVIFLIVEFAVVLSNWRRHEKVQ